jgi:hypothetical protein
LLVPFADGLEKHAGAGLELQVAVRLLCSGNLSRPRDYVCTEFINQGVLFWKSKLTNDSNLTSTTLPPWQRPEKASAHCRCASTVR